MISFAKLFAKLLPIPVVPNFSSRGMEDIRRTEQQIKPLNQLVIVGRLYESMLFGTQSSLRVKEMWCKLQTAGPKPGGGMKSQLNDQGFDNHLLG